MPGKRERPNMIKRGERHNKHLEMKKQTKKRKRENMSQFKDHLHGVKKPKNHALAKFDDPDTDDEKDVVEEGEMEFRELLKRRSQVRKARFDRWRNGRKARGTIRLFGYALDPHASQAKFALMTSRQAFSFQEPQLPYWMIPDEESDGGEEQEDVAVVSKTESNTALLNKSGEEHEQEDGQAAAAAGELTNPDSVQPTGVIERLKMVHGDIVLTSPWEMSLYIDCLLQAGSKIIKNRHTTANRGAPPYFPPLPSDRQSCLSLLRSLHPILIVPFWNLIESNAVGGQGGGQGQEENLDKINESVKLIKDKLSASNTAYAFNLRRPGLVEKWIAPLLKRLVVLDLWKPDVEIKEWIDLSLVMQEEGGSKGSDVVERIKLFHTTGEGKVRPDWVDVETEETVWR